MAAAQTDVERALVTIVKCFFDHAAEEGKKDTLSREEFNKLVSAELPHLKKDVSAEEKMEKLDINQDKEMKFKEYWRLIGERAKQIKEEVKAKKK
ncbi:protein S100-A13 [Mixophyes fleayi]|uniref:protein S100-A13 n=1 Tax=Mixophyes fleayi TaxID=3061075 RepID=UPI003F4DB286